MAPRPTAFDTSPDEARRLAVLHGLALLDSEPEREFDALVALAAQMLSVPTALLTLVDRDRQWIKAAQGLDETEMPRNIAFCDHTIRHDGPMMVDDATRDDRFANNPLVTGPHGIRFYAGMPIHAPDKAGTRHAVGAICIIDRRPRILDEAGRAALRHLATLAEAMIAARGAASQAIAIAVTADRQASELSRQDRVFHQAERMAKMGSWRVTIADQKVHWSEGVFRIHGLPIDGIPPLHERALKFYPIDDRVRLSDALGRTIETGEPFDLELDFVSALGQRLRVRTMGERERNDDGTAAVIGVFQDVTERHALENTLRRSADTDGLTNLLNRAAFDRAFEAEGAAARVDGAPLALALIDLDGFKRINDTLGHAAGDDVLRSVGRRLHAGWFGRCCVARIGGDEFALITRDPALIGDLDRLRASIEDALVFSITTDGLTMPCAGTVAVGLFANDGSTVHEFHRRVDTLLYAAKRRRIGDRRRAA